MGINFNRLSDAKGLLNLSPIPRNFRVLLGITSNIARGLPVSDIDNHWRHSNQLFENDLACQTPLKLLNLLRGFETLTLTTVDEARYQVLSWAASLCH
jgi:hypothetical protein